MLYLHYKVNNTKIKYIGIFVKEKTLLLIILLLFSIGQNASPNPTNIEQSWSMFRGNSHHNGYISSEIGDYNILNWTVVELEGRRIYSHDSTIVVARNGIIYFRTDGIENGLFAIKSNQKVLWYFPLESDESSSCPAIDLNNTIYLCSNGSLLAINSFGSFLWKYHINNDKIIGHPTLNKDKIYVCTEKGFILSIFNNGTLFWRKYIGGIGRSNAAISDENIIYVVGRLNESGLFAIEENGSSKWFTEVQNLEYIMTPTIDRNGIIYVYDTYSFLYSFYPNGTIKWRYPIEHGDEYSSTRLSIAIGNDNILYSGSYTGLYAIFDNGTLKWKITTTGTVTSPIISKNNIIVFNHNEELWAVDSNGSIVWIFKEIKINGEPIYGTNSNIYIIDSNGLYELKTNIADNSNNNHSKIQLEIYIFIILLFLLIISIILYYRWIIFFSD